MLTIQLKDIKVPFILISWTDKDLETPLNLMRGSDKIRLYIKSDKIGSLNKSILVYGVMNLYIDNPENLLKGLNHDSKEEELKVAKYIFELYKDAIREISNYARLCLGFKNIFEWNASFDDLFSNTPSFGSERVFWKIDDTEYQPFELDLADTRKINPVFEDDKLMSPHNWGILQNFINDNPTLSNEVQALLTLWQKTAWNEKRLAAVEASSIIELALREKVEKVLISQGVSNKKIKDIKKEIGMSILLNLLIPLSISKAEYESLKSQINQIDDLRKIRNDIMHEGLREENIDSDIVSHGIRSAISLLQFLEQKFP